MRAEHVVQSALNCYGESVSPRTRSRRNIVSRQSVGDFDVFDVMVFLYRCKLTNTNIKLGLSHVANFITWA